MSDPAGADAAQLPGTSPGRGTVVILVARVVQLVSGFGVSVVLARGLGPVEFGIYGVVMSLLTWLERLINAGIPTAAATMMARMPERRTTVERSTRFLMVLYALPWFGLGWAFAPTIAERMDIPSGATLIRIALLNIPVMALYFAYEGVYGGRRAFSQQSLLHILQAVAKLVGVALLFLVGLTVAGSFVVHVAATVLAVLYVALRHRIGPGDSSVPVMRKLFRIAFPIGVYFVALSVLMSLSLWQLQAAGGLHPEDVGYFVAGINLTRIMMMVPSSVSGVLFASLAWAISTSQPDLVTKYVQGAIRFGLIVMVPACVLLCANASEVMELLYGEEYASGGRILALLSIAFSMIAIFDVLFSALMAAGRMVLSAVVLIALVPLLYLLDAAWIASYGAVGAALASAVAMGIGALASFILTHRILAPPVRLATLGRVGVAGLVAGVASLLVSATGLWLLVELACAGILYLAILWMSGEVSLHEARHFAVWKPERGRGR